MKVKYLDFSYQDYVAQGSSIVNAQFGKYIVYGTLGKGAFGTVYKGMDDIAKKDVAIKLIDLAAIQKDEKNPRVKEIRKRLARTQSEMMNKISSHHVMKLLDVFENNSLKIMVIQYCNEGTLSSMIYKRQKIPQNQAVEILKQIILGISEMHKLNIIHRDLKSQNIMSHNGVIKIVDLGFAKMLPSSSDIYKGTSLGTCTTMAPEVMRKQQYGVKADIWSIGVIFYQMIYGKFPFDPMKTTEMYQQIITKDIFPNQGQINGFRPSQEVLQLMKQILVIDQNHRLSWNELISQKIFQKDPTKLSSQIITVDIENIERRQEDKKQKQKTQEQRLKQLQEISPTKNISQTVILSKLTQREKQSKIKQINQRDKYIMQGVQEYYLQCLKTEFILHQIIWAIEKSQFFDLSDRQTVELLLLLSSRCYYDIRYTQQKLENDSNQAIDIMMDKVRPFYKNVTDNYYRYDVRLRQVEDNICSIISDRFKMIFTRDQINTKNKFLSGDEVPIERQYQGVGYTKNEQIEYTIEEYLKPILLKMNQNNALARKLKSYKRINDIQKEELNHQKFHQLVEKIISQ